MPIASLFENKKQTKKGRRVVRAHLNGDFGAKTQITKSIFWTHIMSGFFSLCETCGTHGSTGGRIYDVSFEDFSGFVECLLHIADHFPIYLTVIMYTISITKHSLFFFVMGLGLSFAGLIPYVSLASHLLAYFITSLLLFSLIYFKRVDFYLFTLMYAFSFFSLYARVYKDIDSELQLVLGGVVGIGQAIIWALLTYYVVSPLAPWVCNTWIVKNVLGLHDDISGIRDRFDYIDELFYCAAGIQVPVDDPLVSNVAWVRPAACGGGGSGGVY